MEQDANPYRAPDAPLRAWDVAVEEDGDATAWRDGKDLVTWREAILPARCVKCGVQAQVEDKARKFYWHAAGVYLLFLINALLYVLVAMFVRKRAQLHLALCAHHRRRRRRWIGIGWAGFVGGFVAAFAFGTESGGRLAGGLVLAFVAAIAGLIGARILVPRRFDDRHARFRGCGEAFLAQLPDYRSRSASRGRREPTFPARSSTAR